MRAIEGMNPMLMHPTPRSFGMLILGLMNCVLSIPHTLFAQVPMSCTIRWSVPIPPTNQATRGGCSSAAVRALQASDRSLGVFGIQSGHMSQYGQCSEGNASVSYQPSERALALQRVADCLVPRRTNKNTLKDEWRRVNLSDLHLGLRPVCRVLIWMPLQHQLSITSAPSAGPVR